MIKYIILGLTGFAAVAIGADQVLSQPGGQPVDVFSLYGIDKLLGTGGAIGVLVLVVKYMVNRLEKKDDQIEALHDEKEKILHDQLAETLKVLIEVRDAIRTMNKNHGN